MNITSHTPMISMPTVANLPTESLRRENLQREVITQVSATNRSAAEKGAASEKERARTPAQNNEQVDFASLRKQAEHETESINGEHQEHNSEHQEQEQNPNAFNQQQNDEDEKPTQSPNALSPEEEQVVSELKTRDLEVKAHEMAHASVGGSTTGSPSYSYEVGPDGKKYAVSGEVSVDLSRVAGDPQATIAKMQKVHAAALAPANPSAQDTRVAANATQIILQAQSDLLSQQNEERHVNKENNVKGQVNVHLNDESNNEFDSFINQTLADQETLVPSHNSHGSTAHIQSQQSLEIAQRAQRIENFYQDITQAYNKPDSYQFELTA